MSCDMANEKDDVDNDIKEKLENAVERKGLMCQKYTCSSSIITCIDDFKT